MTVGELIKELELYNDHRPVVVSVDGSIVHLESVGKDYLLEPGADKAVATIVIYAKDQS